MAYISKSIQANFRYQVALIPADVLKSIDQSELLDRLHYCAGLVAKANAAGTNPAIRSGYTALARAAIRARPRAEVEREVAECIAKAAGLGPSSAQGGALRRKAQEILELDPVSPRREDSRAVTVAKAKAQTEASDLVVCYDAEGQIFGIASRSKIQPVSTSGIVVKTGKARPAAPGRSPGRR